MKKSFFLLFLFASLFILYNGFHVNNDDHNSLPDNDSAYLNFISNIQQEGIYHNFLKGYNRLLDEDHDEAEKYFLKAINEDHFYYAYPHLCRIYYLQKNHIKLNKTASRGIQAGNNACHYYLNLLYISEEANKVEQSKHSKLAIPYLLEKEKSGDALAQTDLGISYDILSIHSSEKNKKTALVWYKKAVKQGYARAEYNLSNSLDKKGQFDEAKQWCQKAAEQGYVYAEKDMGHYNSGLSGFPLNDKEAFYWYQRAAKKGLATAENHLGLCYEKGRGVEVNYDEAAKLYRQAAEKGDIEAQFNLGRCYEYGHGVQQYFGKAIIWYNKAAEQGFALAETNLGCLYSKGFGVTRNYTTALFFFKKAAKKEEEHAQYFLGYFYENGIGAPMNINKAIEWYRKSAEKNHPAAVKRLAKLEGVFI